MAGHGGLHLNGSSQVPISDEVKALVAQFPMELPNVLLTSDPPLQTRHRVLVSKALNPKRVREFEPRIQRVVDELVDDFVDAGGCEFMTRFAKPLPGRVSAEILGVRDDEIERCGRWADLFVEGLIEPVDNPRRAEIASAVIEYQERMLRLIAERRAAPVDDLLNDLVYAEIEAEDDLGEAGLTGPR